MDTTAYEHDFAGRVAFVSGAATGIGETVARRLVKGGASVLLAGHDGAVLAAIAEELGHDRARAFELDVRDEGAVRRAVGLAIEAFGGLHCAVNAAGVTGPAGPSTEDVSLDDWRTVIDVDLTGTFLCMKEELPRIAEGGGGAIVNTASTGGFSGDITRIAYSVSKAAIIGLTRQIATHHGAQGVRCNAVAPGLVLTPGTRGAAASVIDVMQRHLLVPEFGEPEDIAALVCFLASGEARYINGQTYIADGGMLAHNPTMADLVDMAKSKKSS